MSAAATAAGYLYASGRLRGRGAREDAEGEAPEEKEKPRATKIHARKTRVAVYEPEAAPPPEKPKRMPKIEYKTRRWTPHE
jgi:membrane-bound lytic murein transglycosylase B